jgi:hypothetical protein
MPSNSNVSPINTPDKHSHVCKKVLHDDRECNATIRAATKSDLKLAIIMHNTLVHQHHK